MYNLFIGLYNEKIALRTRELIRWICQDDVPKEDQYSISVYEVVNTQNTAPNTIPRENYDLMTLVVIKLGNMVYNGDKEDEGYELLRFLNTIMYPHKDGFMDTVSEYIIL